MYRNILIATDGSEMADKVAAYGLLFDPVMSASTKMPPLNPAIGDGSQVALCQPLEFEGRLPWAPQGLVDPPPRAKPAPVLCAVKQTTLDRACGPEPGPRWREEPARKWIMRKAGS